VLHNAAVWCLIYLSQQQKVRTAGGGGGGSSWLAGFAAAKNGRKCCRLLHLERAVFSINRHRKKKISGPRASSATARVVLH